MKGIRLFFFFIFLASSIMIGLTVTAVGSSYYLANRGHEGDMLKEMIPSRFSPLLIYTGIITAMGPMWYFVTRKRDEDKTK